MNMTRNEKRILFTFGCPNREATIERLCYAAALAAAPRAIMQMLELAKKLDNEELDEWYRNFYYALRLEAEYPMLYQQKKRQFVAERLDRISRQERYNGRFRIQKEFDSQTE